MNDKRSILEVLESQTVAEERGEFVCFVTKSFSGFDGHFRDFKVFPGVVQIHWAVEAVRIVSKNSDLTVKELSTVKFVNFITPDTGFTVEVELKNSRWLYKIFNDDQIFSTGRITSR